MICFSENPLLHVQSPPRRINLQSLRLLKIGGPSFTAGGAEWLAERSEGAGMGADQVGTMRFRSELVPWLMALDAIAVYMA